ncbi:MAG: hypothetical protein DRH24_18750 [Deltaproteobacteria bacterium]|nr:MAG: hypothetical protein DRH24_18750 [Deltaproteobacteria bacterium]
MVLQQLNRMHTNKLAENDNSNHGKSLHRVTCQSTWFALAAVILLTVVLRYGLLDVPLERDEGEYAYAGQLILQGISPYKELFSMKLPGIYAAYAGLLALFGETNTGIHTGLLLINVSTILLLFFLGKRLINPVTGVVAAASFAVLSAGQSVQGMFANAEHFVILPAVGGLLLLLRALDDDGPWLLFSSGLLMGISFLMKQHAAAFIAFGGSYIIIDQLCKRRVNRLSLTLRCALFTIGAIIPYGLACLIFMLAGVFQEFWFCTVEYARTYISQVPIDHAWEGFKDRATRIAGSAPLVWTLAGLGLTALIWDRQARRQAIFIAMFAIFSFLAICPGFYFRPHYFILILPVSALLAGIAISAVTNILSNIPYRVVQYVLPLLLAVICLIVSIYQQQDFLFQMTPVEACRSTYRLNPFPESVQIGRFIRAHTKEDDRIAVIGSEPQIYFYSGRRSASKYIYMYPLMEHHDFALEMQKEMIQEIESAQPEFLIFVRINTSWLQRPNSHKFLFDWFETYKAKYYKLVGLVDLLDDKSVYQWMPNIKWPPRSSHWIAILKRKI